ncbi:MAG: hypothetical protein IT373_20355 [Polyangiaceae bacterium]|nr:hypothetical protein [Polyangiaceae bacterium]
MDIDVTADLATSHTDAATSPFAYGLGIFSYDGDGPGGLVFNHPYGMTLVTGVQGGAEVSSYPAWVAPNAVTIVDLFPRPLK